LLFSLRCLKNIPAAQAAAVVPAFSPKRRKILTKPYETVITVHKGGNMRTTGHIPL
jgi:hypothetical protein